MAPPRKINPISYRYGFYADARTWKAVQYLENAFNINITETIRQYIRDMYGNPSIFSKDKEMILLNNHHRVFIGMNEEDYEKFEFVRQNSHSDTISRLFREYLRDLAFECFESCMLDQKKSQN